MRIRQALPLALTAAFALGACGDGGSSENPDAGSATGTTTAEPKASDEAPESGGSAVAPFLGLSGSVSVTKPAELGLDYQLGKQLADEMSELARTESEHVLCDEAVQAKVGSSVECTLYMTDKSYVGGAKLEITATVTEVDGNQVTWKFEAADERRTRG